MSEISPKILTATSGLVNTGDATDMVGYLGILGLAAIVLAGLVIVRRRDEE